MADKLIEQRMENYLRSLTEPYYNGLELCDPSLRYHQG